MEERSEFKPQFNVSVRCRVTDGGEHLRRVCSRCWGSRGTRKGSSPAGPGPTRRLRTEAQRKGLHVGSREGPGARPTNPGSSLNMAATNLKAKEKEKKKRKRKKKKKKCTERKTENTDQSWVKGRNSTFYLRFTEKVSTFPLGDIS